MKYISKLLFCVLFINSFFAKQIAATTTIGIIGHQQQLAFNFNYTQNNNPLTEKIILTAAHDTLRRKKIITSICAFPFPFGFMGMHRIILGTKPWIPVVYVATLGGCFGILPMIDFLIIIHKKDLTPLENYPSLFIWAK